MMQELRVERRKSENIYFNFQIWIRTLPKMDTARRELIQANLEF